MRFVIGILGAICLGGMSLAQADPPSSAPAPEAATPAATPSATQPSPSATSSAPAAAAQTAQPAAPAKDGKETVLIQGTPEYDALEKHFLSEGYKLEMRGGEKVLCRREEELGSRLGGQKVCATPVQLMLIERDAQRSVDSSQMQHSNPSGK